MNGELDGQQNCVLIEVWSEAETQAYLISVQECCDTAKVFFGECVSLRHPNKNFEYCWAANDAEPFRYIL